MEGGVEWREEWSGGSEGGRKEWRKGGVEGGREEWREGGVEEGRSGGRRKVDKIHLTFNVLLCSR